MLADAGGFEVTDQDPLMDFVIKGYDIDSLKKKAEQFITMVGNLVPADQEKLSLSAIKDAVSQIEKRDGVCEVWGAMQKYNLEGVIYTITRKDGSNFYIAYLNDKILDLMEGDATKPISQRQPKDVACANAYFRELKSVYLHEIGHLILKRKSSSMPVSFTSDENVGDSGVLKICERIHDLYSKARIRDEFDCDLLSFVFAFWPIKQFTRSVMSALCHWNDAVAGDMRIQVANKFHMPVNATVQWMSILFYDKFGMHYIRREEGEKKWLDSLDCSKTIDCFFSNDVFLNHETAAWKAANDGLRTDKRTMNPASPFLCAAFYERREWFCNKQADEIIVVGFISRKVKEEVNIFTAGAA